MSDIPKITVGSDDNSYRLDELLTVSMIMEIFDVSRLTVYNWLGDGEEIDGVIFYPNGKFPNSFKASIGGSAKIYIPVSNVKDYINKKQKNFPQV